MRNFSPGFGFSSGGGGGPAPAPYNPYAEPSLFVGWAADDPNMVTETISQTFAPSDVNTTTDKITLPITGFTRNSNYQFGLFRFSTTGTLPAPFVTGKDYIGENNGDGTFSFWPTDTTYIDYPGHDAGETFWVGHAYAYQRNKIDITTQGTGIHTISSYTLITTIKNKKDNTNLFTETSRDAKFRLLSDESGPYIYHPGPTAPATDFVEPNGPLMTDALTAAQVGDFFENKRYLYMVAAMTPLPAIYMSKDRATLRPSDLNAGSGVFSKINHGIPDGAQVDLLPMSAGAAFPTPTVAFAPLVYAHRINSDTFTLHPTQADAIANTNKYTFSNTGSGVFCVTGGTAVKTSAGNRRIVFDLCMQSNDHTFSNNSRDSYSSITLSSSSYFLTGSSNGTLNFVQQAADIGNDFDVLKVYLYIPSKAVGPICQDTGLPLETGVYYLTKQPSSGTRRLHRTLLDAQASVGIGVSSLSNTQVIKYGTLGSGIGRIVAMDRFCWRDFDDLFPNTASANLATYGQGGVYASLTDFNDAGGKRILTSGVGALNNLLNKLAGSKDTPIPAKSSFSMLIYNNAGQPHIPGHFKVREVLLGASDTDPTAIVNNMGLYLASKWGYSYAP